MAHRLSSLLQPRRAPPVRPDRRRPQRDSQQFVPFFEPGCDRPPQKILQVFGSDWSTPDGGAVRDYIHVIDLAEGHCAAPDVLLADVPQLLTLNLGSGIGVSVLQLIEAFEAASGRKIPFQVVDRRSGDAVMSLAAARLLWHTQLSLAYICRDGWAWQPASPVVYVSFL